MAFNMTFKNEGDYVICYINGKEVSRTKKSDTGGTDEQQVIDIINDQIKANPEMAGDEPDLEGLELSGDKYAVPQGGGGSVETLSISISNWGTMEQPVTVQLTQEQMQKISDGAIIEIIDESDARPNKLCYKSDDITTKNMCAYFTSYTIGRSTSSTDLFTYMVYIDKTTNMLAAAMISEALTSAYMNSIVDANGNNRFVEGTCTLNNKNGITWTYNKWSLSGTHLMIVICGSVTSSSVSITTNSFGSVVLPSYIKDKIRANANNKVEVKTINFYDPYLAVADTVKVSLSKWADLALYWGEEKTLSANGCDFRIQFDLLIDTE